MFANVITQVALLINGINALAAVPIASVSSEPSERVEVAQLNKQVGLPASFLKYQSDASNQPDAPKPISNASARAPSLVPGSLSNQNNQVFTKELVEKISALADMGNPDAQYILGLLYYYGLGVHQDYTQSANLYTQASAGGSVEAMNNLAQLYDSGSGVVRDPKTAIQYFEQAANKGFALAAYNLGTLYQGEEGVTPDLKKAVFWWKKAAHDSSLPAIFKLACAYQIGLGVEKDTKQALALFEKAANSDFGPAQFKLAEIYENGDGIQQNFGEAARLYLKAAMGGSPEALQKLKSMDISPLVQIGSNPNKPSL